MFKDVKKVKELEKIFQDTPAAIIDFAYEAIVNSGELNRELTTEEKAVFNENTNLLKNVPVGELLSKVEKFLDLDIFSSDFKILEGMRIWGVIQNLCEESVKQTRFQ